MPLFSVANLRLGFRQGSQGHEERMTGRAIAGLAMVAASAALTACVPPEPIRGTARATAPTPSYVVSIPVPAARPTPRPRMPTALARRIEALARAFPGRAGIAIRAVDEGWTVEGGAARRRMPQQSVSKLWVALTVLRQRDEGRLRLDDPVTLTRSDLTVFHQPIAALVPAGGTYTTTVGDLLSRALRHSDNTANDRLLTLVGGPSAVRAMIADRQLGDIRFGPGERHLQAGTAGLTWQQSMSLGRAFQAARARLSPEARTAAMDAYLADPPDGATPLAIADALARLARGELLTETSTRILLTNLSTSVTGRARLKAALPTGWSLAHKTGTGQELERRNAGFNDVGIITAPDGRRYAIAVMIADTREPMRARQALIQAAAGALTGGGETAAANLAANVDWEDGGS